MRRLIVIAVVFAAIAAAAAVATSAIVSARLAKTEIAERISALIGRPVTLRGEAIVTVFPPVSVAVKDVTVAGASGADDPPLITIPSLEVSMKVLPLLMGRIEVGTLTLIDPRIHLVEDDTGSGNGNAGRTRREAVFGALFSGDADVHLGEIILRDGSVTYKDHRTGRIETITAANLRLVRQHTTRAADLSGTLAWRGATIEIEAELADARAAFSGHWSRGHLTLAAEWTQLPEDDDLGFAGPESLSGEAGRSGPPLWSLAKRLGLPIAPGSRLGPLRVAGKFAADERSARVSEATFELDGHVAEGTLALGFGGERPMLTGSLAFDELGLGRYAQAFLPASLAELFALPVSSSWLSHADIDLRASADEVDLRGVQFAETAVRLVARDGHMTLSLDEAGLAGGYVEGRATIAPVKEGVAFRLFARLEDVSVADAGGSIWAARANRLIGTNKSPQGTGTVTLDLSAKGATIGAMVGTLAGWMVADIRDGAFYGIDIVSTLERLVAGNTVIAKGEAPFVPVGGRTQFAALSAYVAVDAGVARAEQFRLAGDGFEVTLSGEGDLKRREVEAEGLASLFAPYSDDSEIDRRPIVELPFGVGGTMREPVVAPGIPRISHRSDDAADRPARIWRHFAGNDRGR